MLNSNIGNKLTSDFLTQVGFEREVWQNGVITWYKQGITIFEESDSFMFATRTIEDGSFKSGYSIKTDTQLINLYFSLTDKILDNETTK